MRAGLSTIHQTLTPEAASVLTHSIAEAARRNHGQTTPLHVAATLLANPSGLLRQACVRSHPHSSHPLQCRALELCFSVALDRLPSTNPSAAPGVASSSTVAEPPISNALMAALKRAQAHQRRGCPEQQQQPLLAVKVELEQLLISILDDPSVSRVMREASFSSTAVKAAVEQSLTSSSSTTTSSSAAASPSPASGSPASPFPTTASLGLNLGLRAAPTAAARNLYMNPRLHQNHPNGPASAANSGGGDQPRTEEVRRVMDILLRSKKRNPVLVGDSDPAAVMREVLQKIEDGTCSPPLQTAKIMSVEKELAAATAGDRLQIPAKIRELGSTIGSNISDEHGVVLDLGDLKWLVESTSGASAGSGAPQAIVSEAGRAAVAEMGKLLKMFEGSGRLWLIGTATCTTYLRCQVYHPTMENDWDLDAVPIAPRPAQPNMIQRLGGNGILSSSIVSLSPVKNFTGLGTSLMPQRLPPPESADPSKTTSLCPACMENYEHEFAKLVAKEFEKSSPKPESNKALPQWLQLAKLSNGSCTKLSTDHLKSKEQEQMWKQSTEELQKKWHDTCSRVHPNFHPVALTSDRPLAPTLLKPLSSCRPRAAMEPKLTLSQGYSTFESKDSRENISVSTFSEQSINPPGSSVKTDLVLGNSRLMDPSCEKNNRDRVKDLTGCAQDEFSGLHRAKLAGISDIDSFKRLYKGLAEKVGWQQEAASVVTSVVLQCKSGIGKRRTGVTKSDTWLLFIGPDKVGKRKMATVLSELVSGTGPTTVNFGGISGTDGYDAESYRSSRGRTSMDRVIEAVRRNPFSVILLEDVDQADGLVQGSIKRAMEWGRLPDSYGREVSLGSVIFILTTSFVPEELKSSLDSIIQCEERILHSAGCGWQLELSASVRSTKRPADWLFNSEQPTKLQKGSSCGMGLSLDLNLAIGGDDEAGEGSRNSSDVTAEHESEKGRLAVKCVSSSFASELMEHVDSSIVFKPVDFAPLRRTVLESASMKFTALMGSGWAIKIDEDALDRIVGGLWIGGSLFDEWAERVLTPSLKQLKANLKADGNVVIVRLSLVKGERERSSSSRDWLPATVAIAVDVV